MEETFGSENSSGCESGWTLYLEHSHSIQNHKNEDDFKHSFTHEIDDEEEDMSMVSDASSGPQHFPEQEDECFKFNHNGNGIGIYTNRKRQKIPKKIHYLPSFLDDTASSPIFGFSNNNPTKKASVVENEIMEYSQGNSATYFKGKSAFQDHLGLLQSAPGAQLQQNQWLEGKRWG